MKIIHASPGFGSPLSRDQTINFLTNSKLNLRLGTVDEKGEPNIHPVWYWYEDDKLYVGTSKASKKVNNVRRNCTVYFSIDTENPPPKGVRGKGTVKISEDINANIPIAEKIMVKYTGDLDSEIAKFLMNFYKTGEAVVLEISPRYYATWDDGTGFIQ